MHYLWLMHFFKIAVTLFFLLISALFVDEGRTVMLIESNMNVHQDNDHHNDIEIPHQHKHIIPSDNEKLLTSDIFDLSGLTNSKSVIPYSNILIPFDYSTAIWQPPKPR